MREGGKPLPLAFHYLIFMVLRHCDLNLVITSSLAAKCQDFKVEMPFFQPLYVIKLKCWHFVASEDIITKFKSQGLYTIKIKY